MPIYSYSVVEVSSHALQVCFGMFLLIKCFFVDFLSAIMMISSGGVL
jgi:hypothetical protein